MGCINISLPVEGGRVSTILCCHYPVRLYVLRRWRLLNIDWILKLSPSIKLGQKLPVMNCGGHHEVQREHPLQNGRIIL